MTDADKILPVALFLYNRPKHSLETLNALKRSAKSLSVALHVFCDGPKSNASTDDLENIKKVRALARAQDWPASVKVYERESNKGLAASIVDGVTQVLEGHDTIVVFEDDIVCSETCLGYFERALNHFAEMESVFHVSAYVPPIKPNGLPETFFYNQASCWGWATWKRAWKHYESDPKKILDNLKKRQLLDYLNLEGGYNFLSHLEMNISGELNTWAIRWQCSVILKDGLCLHPNMSLTRNIGADASGEHMTENDGHLLQQPISNMEINSFPQELRENLSARKRIANYYRNLSPKPSPFNRLKHTIKVKLGL